MSYPYQKPERRRGSTLVGAVLGVLTGLVVLGVVWVFMLGGGRATPAPTPSRIPASAAIRTPSAPVPVRSTPSVTVRVPSLTPMPSEPSTASGAVTQLRSGSTFVVMDSFAKADLTVEQAVARATQLNQVPRSRVAIVVDTDALPGSLTPGYWAIGVADANNRADVEAICAEYGIPVGGSCYGRAIR